MPRSCRSVYNQAAADAWVLATTRGQGRVIACMITLLNLPSPSQKAWGTRRSLPDSPCGLVCELSEHPLAGSFGYAAGALSKLRLQGWGAPYPLP